MSRIEHRGETPHERHERETADELVDFSEMEEILGLLRARNLVDARLLEFASQAVRPAPLNGQSPPL